MHGETPDALAALGYDAASMLFDAIKRAGTTEGTALAKAISETKNLDGVTGTITIDRDRNAVKPAVVLEPQRRQARLRGEGRTAEIIGLV